MLFAGGAQAHDPLEITSVVYLRTNRIELLVEMEFSAGMTLAGQKLNRDVAVLSQFEAALPQLRELAGGFYDFTAGHNVVQPLATNVELGVENHLRFHVEFAPTPYRPLRFVARGLGASSTENPYGASLTVLDMVKQKVLGQTTLLSATAAAEFPPQAQESPEVAPSSLAPNQFANNPATNLTPVISLPTAAKPPVIARQPNWLLALVTLGAVVFIVITFLRRRK